MIDRRRFASILTGAFAGLRRGFGLPPAPVSSPNPRLWYREPAQNWLQAIPLGNGRLGALVFGGVTAEKLALNEDTLYTEEPGSVDVPLDITRDFDRVVRMIRDGEYIEADEYVTRHWLGRCWPAYQALADLHLRFAGSGEASDYVRELDLSESVCRIRYRQGDAVFEREIFATHPDNAIIVRIRSDKPGALSFQVNAESLHPTARMTASGPEEIVITGQVPAIALRRTLEFVEQKGDQWKYPEIWNRDGSRKPFAKPTLYADQAEGRGMRFEARVRVRATGGSVRSSDSGLEVEGAREAVLLIAAATSYNGFDKSPSRQGVDPASRTKPVIEQAARKTYAQLRAAHTADYKSLFDRVSLDLGAPTAQSSLPTNERLPRFANGQDPALAALYFQFGRYLMISGSRPDTQPLNLQGIWNVDALPPWSSGYTTNINFEMNYWAAETTNLSDCHEPLFRMMEELAVTGARVAKDMYHRPGWVVHHNTTLWRDAQPKDNEALFSFWPMGGGWLCQHAWEHYRFTLDGEFLRKRAYPVMKGAAEFYASWLVDDGTGRLVTPVSSSPENQFIYTDKNGKERTAGIAMGCTLDMAIIRELFRNTVEAARLLDVDTDLRALLQEKQEKLAPYRIGSRGQLLEYHREFKEIPPRHDTSPFYPLYPSDQFTADGPPELTAAMRKLLEERVRTRGVQWHSAWYACCWARLGLGDRAYENIQTLIAANTHPNMFHRSGPYFQIDGNQGGAAAIAEMLLQSHAGEVRLLPALPAHWPGGAVRGLRARGGLEVEMAWKGSLVESCRLRALVSGTHRIRPPKGQSIHRVETGGKAVALRREQNGIVQVTVEAGRTYEVKFA